MKWPENVRCVGLLSQALVCMCIVHHTELYESVLDRSEPLLPPTVYSLFILSLSLHTHSPTVEMFNQVHTHTHTHTHTHIGYCYIEDNNKPAL